MTDKIFEQVYKWEAEKGLSDNKNDKGGLTNDGITWDRFKRVCKPVLGCLPTKERFEALTKEDVQAFYKYSFNNIGCDKIENETVAAVCFDFALNSAYGKREIQRVLVGLGYALRTDNIFGPITIRILNNAAKYIGVEKLCLAILAARQRYVEGLVRRDPSQRVFLAGWTNRINDWKRFVINNSK